MQKAMLMKCDITVRTNKIEYFLTNISTPPHTLILKQHKIFGYGWVW